MSDVTNILLATITLIAGSSFLAAIASNWQISRSKRKKMVADAIQSALKRVEMYYRVRRRKADGSDDARLRDLFHDIQEDNDHKLALLDMESPWIGAAYRSFLGALKRELAPFMKAAWSRDGDGADVQLRPESRPDVDKYVRLFSRDARRLFNPFMRPAMRVRYSIRKLIKDNPYDTI